MLLTRKIGIGLAGMLLAAGTTLTLGSSASASTAPKPGVVSVTGTAAAGPPSGIPCIGTNGAEACFEALGDKTWVEDTASDGHHATGVLFLPDGRSFECNTTGIPAGTWVVCADKSAEIPEHVNAQFWAENREGSTTLSMSLVITVSTT